MLWCGRYSYLLSVSTSWLFIALLQLHNCIHRGSICNANAPAPRCLGELVALWATPLNWQDLTSAFSTCTLSISCTADDSAQPPSPSTRTTSPQSSRKRIALSLPPRVVPPPAIQFYYRVGPLRGRGEEDWLAAAVMFKVKTCGVTGWISSHTHKDARTDRRGLVPREHKAAVRLDGRQSPRKASRSHSALKLLFLSSV